MSMKKEFWNQNQSIKRRCVATLWTQRMAAKNAQNNSQQRTRLWPDSSVVARQTLKQRQLWPSRIKSTVACAERSNEPSTTTRTHTHTDIEIPGTEILGRIFTVFLLRGTYCITVDLLFRKSFFFVWPIWGRNDFATNCMQEVVSDSPYDIKKCLNRARK
jgi:hypothetical protein